MSFFHTASSLAPGFLVRRSLWRRRKPERSARRRLEHEARTASALNHPHICTIHDVGEADGQLFLAMEFVAGRTLDGVLATDGLPDASVVRIGMQLADALDHAHQHGIIGQAYEQKGMYPEAIAALEKAVELSDGNLVMTAALAHAWALAGKRPEAQKVVDRLSRVSQDGYFSPYFIAEIHVALGHTEEALAWLDKAYEARDYFLRWLKIDPRLDPLRSDPRFQSLERRLNYPA